MIHLKYMDLSFHCETVCDVKSKADAFFQARLWIKTTAIQFCRPHEICVILESDFEEREDKYVWQRWRHFMWVPKIRVQVEKRERHSIQCGVVMPLRPRRIEWILFYAEAIFLDDFKIMFFLNKSLGPIKTVIYNPTNQSWRKVNTCSLRQVRENTREQITIACFCLWLADIVAANQLRNWQKTKPIVKSAVSQ